MGIQKRTRKFGEMKRVIGVYPFFCSGFYTNFHRPERCQTVRDDAPRHPFTTRVLMRRRKKNQMAGEVEAKKKEEESKAKREMYVVLL
jgi:hypothetical protein